MKNLFRYSLAILLMPVVVTGVFSIAALYLIYKLNLPMLKHLGAHSSFDDYARCSGCNWKKSSKELYG